MHLDDTITSKKSETQKMKNTPSQLSAVRQLKEGSRHFSGYDDASSMAGTSPTEDVESEPNYSKRNQNLQSKHKPLSRGHAPTVFQLSTTTNLIIISHLHTVHH